MIKRAAAACIEAAVRRTGATTDDGERPLVSINAPADPASGPASSLRSATPAGHDPARETDRSSSADQASRRTEDQPPLPTSSKPSRGGFVRAIVSGPVVALTWLGDAVYLVALGAYRVLFEPPVNEAAGESAAARLADRVRGMMSFLLSGVVHLTVLLTVAVLPTIRDTDGPTVTVVFTPPELEDDLELDSGTLDAVSEVADSDSSAALTDAAAAMLGSEFTNPSVMLVEDLVVPTAKPASPIASGFEGFQTALADGGGGDGTARPSRKSPLVDQIAYARRHGLDLVIVFDSTDSMGPEIEALRDRIAEMARRLIDRIPGTRISLVTYRDTIDAVPVAGIPLTSDIGALTDFLATVRATGGGDEPEDVLAGLRMATEQNTFRPAATKAILLFGDAPPHYHQGQACLRVAEAFRKDHQGTVSTVTCVRSFARYPKGIPEFQAIAGIGGGDALPLGDTRDLLDSLVVLTFGPDHRDEILAWLYPEGLPDGPKKDQAPAGKSPPRALRTPRSLRPGS